MRCIIVLTALMSFTGCTVLRPLEGTSTELRQRISSGELLKAGDRILIVTADEKTHRFAVTAIDANVIEGRTDSVRVEQIVSVQRREFSRTRTLVLVGGIILVAGVAALVAAAQAPAFAL